MFFTNSEYLATNNPNQFRSCPVSIGYVAKRKIFSQDVKGDVVGFYPDLTIRNNRIVKELDSDIYMILDNRNGCRGICTPLDQKNIVVSRIQGNRLQGYTDTIIVKALKGDIFMKTYVNEYKTTQVSFFVVEEDSVRIIRPEQGNNIPGLTIDRSGFTLDYKLWKEI